MITNILSLLADGFETEKFPVADCTQPSPREKGILCSKDLYLCILWDKRWPEGLRILTLIPYVCRSGKRLYYGWARPDENAVYDHIEKPIHEDDERVVAWKKASVGFTGFTVKRGSARK